VDGVESVLKNIGVKIGAKRLRRIHCVSVVTEIRKKSKTDKEKEE
jgi:hypothetical protein